jgi:ABC-type cobalamin transport system ATPase subunit
MAQRVHLARVLAQVWEDPAGGVRYMLLDEPTARPGPLVIPVADIEQGVSA